MFKSIFIAILIFTSLNFFSQTVPIQQWLNRYNGLGNYSDKLNCGAADNSGNSYFAGYTIRTSKRKDYLLIKLTSTGDTLWTMTYNGTGSKDDGRCRADQAGVASY